MRLFRRRGPNDLLDPQLTALRFEAPGQEEETAGKHESCPASPDGLNHISNFLAYEGITPKSDRKMGPASGNPRFHSSLSSREGGVGH